MNIEKITQQSYVSGIPIKGWENVAQALIAYDLGEIKGSRATQDNFTETFGNTSAGGLVVALVGIATHRTAGGFVKRLLGEAGQHLKDNDRWSRSYDYDASGTAFFKSGVNISRLDRKNEVYLLGIYAAYVGNEPEAQLAKYLGVECALCSQAITVQIDSLRDDRCAFDFKAILDKLSGVLDVKKIKGEEALQTFLTLEETSTPILQFKAKGGLAVTFGLGRLEHRFKRELNGKRVETWYAQGAILNCGLAEDYGEKGVKVHPTFDISVSRPDKTERCAPIWQQEEKDNVRALADKIAAAFGA